MRTNKILFAVWLFLVGASECWSAWRQTGNALEALVFLGIIIFLCGLVVRGAYKRIDPANPPSKGWRTFWMVMGILSVLGIFGAFLDMMKPRKFYHIVEVAGLKIPIDDCLSGAKNMVAEEKERTALCTCLANKLSSDTALVRTHGARLERGHMDGVVKYALQNEGPLKESLAECFAQSSMVWTDRMLETAKEQCISEMQADTTYRDYDAEKYCACKVKGLAAHPPSTLTAGGAAADKIREQVHTECLEASKR